MPARARLKPRAGIRSLLKQAGARCNALQRVLHIRREFIRGLLPCITPDSNGVLLTPGRLCYTCHNCTIAIRHRQSHGASAHVMAAEWPRNQKVPVERPGPSSEGG